MAEATKQPTITNANVPQPPAQPQQAVTAYKDIVAKPLGNPDFTSMVHMNPNMSVRWVNCDVGEKHSTMRFNMAQTQGFVACTPEEVRHKLPNGKLVPCPQALIKDGRVIFGDVILMKLPRNDYLGALKYNEQRAVARVRRAGTAATVSKGEERGTREVSANPGDVATTNVLADVTRNPRLANKVQPYVPPTSDLEKWTAEEPPK